MGKEKEEKGGDRGFAMEREGSGRVPSEGWWFSRYLSLWWVRMSPKKETAVADMAPMSVVRPTAPGLIPYTSKEPSPSHPSPHDIENPSPRSLADKCSN